MPPEIINKGESLARNPIEVVGGKGYNLLTLAELSEGRDFKVPEFRIIPVGAQYAELQLEELFELLPKPLMVRSSSPWEDSKGFSFAGRFKSVLGIEDFQSFQEAIDEVLESARDNRARDYARQHGLSIDERMAVIVQEMIDPLYSGVCYSTSNLNNPKTIAEFIGGLSDELMSGNKQGSIASFDRDFHLTMEHGDEMPDLERVARVAKDLEDIFNQRLDVEFAVSKDRQIYIVQARSVTDPTWPDVQIPDIDASKVFLKADIVRGSGSFTGPVFVFRSPTEMQRYAETHNKQPMAEIHEQWSRLRDFNRNNTNGYCLIADNLEAHEIIMPDGGLSNLRALITVDYASRFSHPAKVISETGVFYLGIFGRKDLLDLVETGDTITVMGDQSRGLVYDLTKPTIEQQRVNLEGVPIIQYQTAIEMRFPSYEEVDDRLFVDETGSVGVMFWDYNEEGGVPTDVFYDLVDREGNVIDRGEYRYSQAIRRSPNFPSLLDDLLAEAREKIARKKKTQGRRKTPDVFSF